MRHKKIIFILTLLVCMQTFGSSFAQTPRDSSKCEIGLGQTYFPISDGVTFYPNISFKYKFGRNVVRTGISYNWSDKDDYKRNEIIANIGYEHRFFGPKIQMIVGADFCYYYRHQEPTYHLETNYIYSKIFYNYGIGPVLGGVYNFSKRFSVQTELGFFYGPGTDKYNRSGVVEIENNGPYFTAHRFFSLHLYYKFGEKRKEPF